MILLVKQVWLYALFVVCVPLCARAQTHLIAIQLVDGKNGVPLAGQRVLIFGGHTPDNVMETNFAFFTDEHGLAEVNLDIVRNRWIRVFPDGLTDCYKDPNLVQFSLENAIAQGVSTPNNCGSIKQSLKQRQFTVFARPATFWKKMDW